MRSISLIFLLICSLSTRLLAITADEVIDKHFEATGGKVNWAKVYSVKYSGYYEMGPGMKAPISSFVCTKPFKGIYSDFSWQGMKSMTALKDAAGWSYNPFGGKRESDPLNPDQIHSINLESDPQGMLFNYKDKGYSVDYLGLDDVDGVEVHKLRLSTKDGDLVYFYLDATSYYILKTTKKIKLKEKEELQSTAYSDFRKTSLGLIVAFSQQGLDENGNESGGPSVYEKVEFNIAPDAALFEKPKKK